MVRPVADAVCGEECLVAIHSEKDLQVNFRKLMIHFKMVYSPIQTISLLDDG
jgi:hypothetical protein